MTCKRATVEGVVEVSAINWKGAHRSTPYFPCYHGGSKVRAGLHDGAEIGRIRAIDCVNLSIGPIHDGSINNGAVAGTNGIGTSPVGGTLNTRAFHLDSGRADA